jgi:hypothetical protein
MKTAIQLLLATAAAFPFYVEEGAHLAPDPVISYLAYAKDPYGCLRAGFVWVQQQEVAVIDETDKLSIIDSTDPTMWFRL